MTTEISSGLTPEEVLAATREFFMGPEAVHSAWLEGESATHLSFGTFRGNLAVAAFPDPETGATRVRITTLRDEGAVPRLVSHLGTLEAVGRAAPASGAGSP